MPVPGEVISPAHRDSHAPKDAMRMRPSERREAGRTKCSDAVHKVVDIDHVVAKLGRTTDFL
jgi:hypothetical protein